ncbi:hypothetical protein GALMADRAFT_135220 [Galerina marginata CBS 339.88]|uniref:F-box domain-containing protein n=1 Tax=Galerina marginata (strain CBS 339.88) TaxID=685588 RepID=A0A067TF18_GALM3|nr:hypothetical protein GALMADRAFT_135220 [Galerina marginata CBS 339.88]
MTDSLPPELIDSILSHLSGTPAIAECALVCHAWLPSARHHLLLPPKVLHLDQIQIAEFLHLIDSPRSTLSLVSFSTLHLAQNRVVIDWANPAVPPDAEAWRKHTAVQDFLARDSTFPPITSLFLEWIDWRTLSPTALTSLHSSYKSVKELELRWIVFTKPELCDLIAGLTALEKITVGEGVPFDSASWTADSVQMIHSSLCKLVFSYSPPLWIIQFFARAIRYTGGIVGVSIDISGHRQQSKACGELLEAAGTSLRALKVQALYYNIPLSVDDAVALAELFAFPRNTGLREIELYGIGEINLKLLLQGLKSNAKPNLRQLKLGLAYRDDLQKWTGNWVLADETLSTMLLKEPKLILELPSFRSEPWSFNSEGTKAYESAYSLESFEEVKSLLPRTAERWKLEVEFRD